MNGQNQPVVGVSWYEALAFCMWLNAALTPPWRVAQTITLPTEDQWQRAAQSDDGRVYPWGNQRDKSRANTEKSDIGKTTPVTQYEGKGDSPYGVVDMVGNVREWCLNTHEDRSIYINRSARRVLRGGSWNLNLNLARAVSRNFNIPSYRDYRYGFRLVRAPS